MLPEITESLFDNRNYSAKELRACNGDAVYALLKPENAEIREKVLRAMREKLAPILNRNGEAYIGNVGDNIASNPLLKEAIESVAEGMCTYLYELQQAHLRSARGLIQDIGTDQGMFLFSAMGLLIRKESGAWHNACHRLGHPEWVQPPLAQTDRVADGQEFSLAEAGHEGVVKDEADKAARSLVAGIIGASVAACREALPEPPHPGWPDHGIIKRGSPGIMICDP